MKVGTLIQILQQYDPQAEVKYILQDNSQIGVTSVRIYPNKTDTGEYSSIGMYFKSKGTTSEGREVWFDIG